MISKPNFYLDRTNVAELPPAISAEIKSRNLFLVNDESSVSFVGILVIDNEVNVFLPRSSTIPEDEENRISLASQLMKAVQKYGVKKNTSIDDYNEDYGYQNLTHLCLLKNILDDYLDNGIYKEQLRYSKITDGKINWKKTISRLLPTPSNSESIIYLKTYSDKQDQEISNVTKIHADVMRYITKTISWIFLDRNQEFHELKSIPSPFGDRHLQISALKNELTKVYADRNIRLLKMLINFLEDSSELDTSSYIFGLTKFHFCWEEMLRCVLDNVVDISRRLPKPVYLDKEGKKIEGSSGLRPDVFLHDEKRKVSAIIDAKYYAATSPNDSPPLSDIIKQLIYKQAIETLQLDTHMNNIFIFPGNHNYLEKIFFNDKNIDSVEKPKIFDQITCIYVTPSILIENYIGSKKMLDLTNECIEC